MTSKFRHDPIPFTDAYGRKCLKVSLDKKGLQYAVVRETDYHSVRRSGATGVWCAHVVHGKPYVRTNLPTEGGGYVLSMVARIITGAGKGSAIYYVDGNPLNLLPENLKWGKGCGKRNDLAVALSAKEAKDAVGA